MLGAVDVGGAVVLGVVDVVLVVDVVEVVVVGGTVVVVVVVVVVDVVVVGSGAIPTTMITSDPRSTSVPARILCSVTRPSFGSSGVSRSTYSTM